MTHLTSQHHQLQEQSELQHQEINRLQSVHATTIALESTIASLQLEVQQERNKNLQELSSIQEEKMYLNKEKQNQ